MPQLVVDRTDSIDGAVAHTVHTIARIGGAAPGLMVARSVFRSANWITGFKAAAVVVLIDNNGQITARSDPPTHGWADGTAIGTAQNTVDWTYQFDPAAANNAANIAVLHFPDENYLSNLNGFLAKFGSSIAKIIPYLFGGSSGNNPVSYNPETESGGGGGGEGDAEEGDWALMGTPWQNYTSPNAPTHTGMGAANPNAFQFGAPTTITVHATDAATGATVNGHVYIGATAVGDTDHPFTHTWNPVLGRIDHIDPNTHRPVFVPSKPDPMTVRAQGYNPITVPYTVAGRDAPQLVRPL
jgi:hypothetical protein